MVCLKIRKIFKLWSIQFRYSKTPYIWKIFQHIFGSTCAIYWLNASWVGLKFGENHYRSILWSMWRIRTLYIPSSIDADKLQAMLNAVDDLLPIKLTPDPVDSSKKIIPLTVEYRSHLLLLELTIELEEHRLDRVGIRWVDRSEDIMKIQSRI